MRKEAKPKRTATKKAKTRGKATKRALPNPGRSLVRARVRGGVNGLD